MALIEPLKLRCDSRSFPSNVPSLYAYTDIHATGCQLIHLTLQRVHFAIKAVEGEETELSCSS